MKSPVFNVFSGSKEYRYGLITDKYLSHNTPSLIKKIHSTIGSPQTVASEVAQPFRRDFQIL
jgi:hypothetical protein